MGKQHVIELNGKRYDTLTGKIIADNPLPSTSKSKPTLSPKVGSIDGFSRKKQPASATNRHTNQAVAHKAEKSKTLMRKTVAKPKSVPATSAQSTKAQPISHDTAAVNQKRLANAKQIPKSPIISRFSSRTDGLRAKPQAQPTTTNKVSTPAAKPSAAAAAAVAPATTSKSLVDKALAQAKTPDVFKLKKDKHSVRIARKLHLTPRQVSVGGFAIALFLVTGFFAYQNATNLSMRIASSRAGIHGNLPGYQPAGFSVSGGIAYNPGQITIAYKSTSDNRNFKIMQNVSDWNSQALLDNFVASNHPNNQTVQDRGKTIYIYDGSNATWVDGGIWYRIEGESQLNSDQLLNIAASL